MHFCSVNLTKFNNQENTDKGAKKPIEIFSILFKDFFKILPVHLFSVTKSASFQIRAHSAMVGKYHKPQSFNNLCINCYNGYLVVVVYHVTIVAI